MVRFGPGRACCGTSRVIHRWSLRCRVSYDPNDHTRNDTPECNHAGLCTCSLLARSFGRIIDNTQLLYFCR
jgi:hypothetical protein